MYDAYTRPARPMGLLGWSRGGLNKEPKIVRSDRIIHAMIVCDSSSFGMTVLSTEYTVRIMIIRHREQRKDRVYAEYGVHQRQKGDRGCTLSPYRSEH